MAKDKQKNVSSDEELESLAEEPTADKTESTGAEADIDDIEEKYKEKEKEAENEDSAKPRKKTIKDRLVNLRSVRLRDQIFFVQNLRVMIKGGLSLGESLKTITIQISNPLFKKVLINISQAVQAGTSFSDALKKHPKIFSELFVNMIKSGELSGNLEDVLEKLHIQMKRDHDLISKIKGAMIYPLVVVIAMVGIGTAMIIFVVPKLIVIFDEVGAELPLATKLLIGLSKLVTTNGLWVGLGLVVFIILFVDFYKSAKGKLFWHKVFLATPILGNIVKKVNIARFCRTVSSLLKTDISIVDSLKITALVVGNVYYKQALRDASQKIVKGLQINKVLSAYPKLFTPTVLQMLKVGEESGAVDSVLDEVAQFYEEDINQVMENLPAIVEPVLILCLGVGVGAMAIAIIMPMYSLTNAF